MILILTLTALGSFAYLLRGLLAQAYLRKIGHLPARNREDEGESRLWEDQKRPPPGSVTASLGKSMPPAGQSQYHEDTVPRAYPDSQGKET